MNWSQSLAGMRDWEFGGKASFEGLVDWMNKNADQKKAPVISVMEYLKSVDEDPRDYVDEKTQRQQEEAFENRKI
jgi:hypothetical protein